MNNKYSTRILVAATAVMLSVAPLWKVLAEEYTAQSPAIIMIPGGDLDAALKALARQTGVQLMYDRKTVAGIVTKGVRGAKSTQDAIEQLLEGTALTVKKDASGAMLIAGPVPARLSERGVSANVGSHEEAGILASVSIEETGSSAPDGEAAPASGDLRGAKLEEIVVTAQKREERLIDVPISIVALSADAIRERQATSLDDLELAVPGLSIQSSGTFQRRIMLRGVSNTFGSAPLVSMYLDEASVTSGPASQLDLRTYDLERVEVLRGPQGTLYGEGSAGGTIRFITKNPVLDQVAMKADFTGLYTEEGGPGQRVEGAVNVPLIHNELGLRIAGTFENLDGWMNQPAVGKKNFNDQKLVNLRIKGLWQPIPQFTANIMALIHRNDTPPTQGEDENGNYTQTFGLTTTPSGQDKYGLYNLTLTYDLPAVRVLSTTSYVDQDEEISYAARFPLLGPPPAPRFEFYTPLTTEDAQILTSELRLMSIGTGRWKWTVGGYYRDMESYVVQKGHYNLPGVFPPGYENRGRAVSKSWAAFGDTRYELTNRWTLGAGLRYFSDDQQHAGVFTFDPTDPLGPASTASFHSVSPRLYAQYEVTEKVNTYASAAKGFRSGGFNGPGQPNFDPEEIWTYELGTKMSLADGSLSTDVAVFYTEYSDVQIIGTLPPPAPFVPITSNAGDALIRGIEGSLTWVPTDAWTFGLNGTYSPSEFSEVRASSSSHNVGDRLDLSSEYSFTLSAQRDFEWNGRRGFARLDYNEQGESIYRNRNLQGPTPWYYSESDIINMLNFHLSMQWSERLSLGLFGQNLLNDRGYTDPFQIDDFAGRARPRTYGMQFGVTFD